MKCYSAVKRNEVPNYFNVWMNLDNIMVSEKKADTKGHICCDYIHKKCLEQANPQEQIEDSWLPGAGGGGNDQRLLNGHSLSLQADEDILELDIVIMLEKHCECTNTTELYNLK